MAETVRHICGISGGKDSSALAIYLRDKVPEMEYFFCDTGAELPETYEYLTRLEVILGKSIVVSRSTWLRPLVRGIPWDAALSPDAMVYQEHEDQTDRGMDRRSAALPTLRFALMSRTARATFPPSLLSKPGFRSSKMGLTTMA